MIAKRTTLKPALTLGTALLLAPLGSWSALSAEPPPIVFNRDIRPILSDKCFSCHGPDARQRKAELRLDTPEGAYGKTESGAVAIVPGDLAKSEAWARINAADSDRSPPFPSSDRPSSVFSALGEKTNSSSIFAKEAKI